MTDPQLRPSTATSLAFGSALIALGVLLNLLSRMADGFVQGLCLGAGVMLILMGAFWVSAPIRRRFRGGAEPVDTWLPSRDGD